MKFTEAQLEKAVIELFVKENFTYVKGEAIDRETNEVLIKQDLSDYLIQQYADEDITTAEIKTIQRKLESYPNAAIYDSNKEIMNLVANGFPLKREDRSKKDLFIHLIDYKNIENNTFKIVNQFEIYGYHKRIPDAIIFINGLPLVVIEFKSAIRENATIYDAFNQLTIRYQRDIPELFKYNAFCVISDGINNKAGSFFAPYEFFYAWRKITGDETEVDGIDSLYSMVQGMFNKSRLLDIIHNFVYLPDTSKKELKILCRYPQYYAARKLFHNIKAHQRPIGDGKGGTYFGATGSGKSYTMLQKLLVQVLC